MSDPMANVALLAGASGLVGGALLELLLNAGDYSRVYAVTRRPLGREHPRLANRIVQFDRLEAQLAGLSCQVAFCCLGAGARSAAPADELERVDRQYVLAFARAARAARAQRFVVVSAAGADPAADDPWLRVKGTMERELAGLGFPSLDILQPARLLGLRRGMRPLDAALQVLLPLVNPFLVGAYAVHRGVPAATVAAAMLGAARSGRRGVYRYAYAGMQALARARAPSPAAAQA